MRILPLVAVLLVPPTWTLTLGGDVMLNSVKAGSKPLEAIAKQLRSADLAIVNLEIPLTDAKTRTTRKTKAELKRKAQFILRADPKHAAYLAKCGIDAVSLANNHAMDYRAGGLAQVLKVLDAHRIRHAGAGASLAAATAPALLVTPGGERVALLSYATFVGKASLWHISPASADRAGVAALDLGGTVGPQANERLRLIVRQARKRAGFVAVALHGGVERQSLPTSYQVSLGRAFVDAGADLVIGHHPHVLQGAEIYRGKPILYSLGNLISPRPSITGVFHLRFAGGRLTGFTITPCKVSGGKTTPLRGKQATAARNGFNALCAKLLKRFPSKRSRPLTSPQPPAPKRHLQPGYTPRT